VCSSDLKRRAEEEKRRAEEDKARTIMARLDTQYSSARKADERFDAMVDLAKEVMERDTSGVFAAKLYAVSADPEGDVAGYVKQLARLHEGYDALKTPAKKGDTKATEKVNKAISNAEKRTSSAAVGSGGAGGALSEEELTVAEAANLSDAQFAKLSPATRERLLMESCR